MEDFEAVTDQLKALSDPIRLKIIDMLSCMELCACSLLEGLSITQPTLSHHMKILLTSRFVTSSKKGTWVYYKINQVEFENMLTTLNKIRMPKPDCSCYEHIYACAEKKQQKQTKKTTDATV